VFASYGLQLNAPTAYLLELIPCLPIFVLVALAARFRALKPDALSRSYLIQVIAFAALSVVLGLLMVTSEVSFFRKSISATCLDAAFPFLAGMVPAFALLMPKRMMRDSNLGEMLNPVHIKRKTPTVRLLYRLTAVVIVYIICDFASQVFFNSYGPKGVLAYAIALLPVLPIFCLIWIYNRYMAEEQDEFQRHLFNQSILWAFLGTLIFFCAIWQLEERALIPFRPRDRFPSYWVVMLFYFLQLEAGFVIQAIQAARLKRNQ
jgi:hypothetical protein